MIKSKPNEKRISAFLTNNPAQYGEYRWLRGITSRPTLYRRWKGAILHRSEALVHSHQGDTADTNE